MSIGMKLKFLRHQNNLTQKELCGNYINRVILSRIENDKMLPSLEQLHYLSQRLNKDIDYFLSDAKCIDDIYTGKSIKEISKIFEMYQNGQYYEIIKAVDGTYEKTIIDDYDGNYYIGMSYFNLEIDYEATKLLKMYVNKYLHSNSDIQKKHVINFLTALNTLFKIMIKNENNKKCAAYLKVALKYINLYNADNVYVSFSIYNNLAYLYLKQDEFDNIIILLEPFLNSHKILIFTEVLASMYKALNIAYYNINNYEISIKAIKKAIYLYYINDDAFSAGKCYYNYINALRYSNKFDEAVDIVNKCLADYSNYIDLYQKFLLQKMILYFNTEKYNEVLNIAKLINPIKIDTANRYDYYFIIGHIEHTFNKNDKKAYGYLIKAEKHYKQNNYNDDLYTLLYDLYEITEDKLYRIEANNCMNSIYKRKNIISSCLGM